MALREMSLRQAAHRLHQDVEAARQVRAVVAPWATAERLLVCVGPSPSSAKIIRTAKRMAAAFGAEWMAVAVDTGRDGQAASAAHELTSRNLQLAEQLGAETHTLIGRNVADSCWTTPVTQCHQDHCRQNGPAGVEALALSHGRRRAAGARRRHRRLRDHRRRQRIAAAPPVAASQKPQSTWRHYVITA